MLSVARRSAAGVVSRRHCTGFVDDGGIGKYAYIQKLRRFFAKKPTNTDDLVVTVPGLRGERARQ